MIAPKFMDNPPRLFSPVTFQSPRIQNSPNLFSKSSATGLRIVTSCPSKLSQKSSPNLSGWSVLFSASSSVWLFGTERIPSTALSNEEKDWVGGERSSPMTRGVTGLPEDNTTMFLGLVISVADRSFGEPLDLNSSTTPPKLIESPTLT